MFPSSERKTEQQPVPGTVNDFTLQIARTYIHKIRSAVLSLVPKHDIQRLLLQPAT